MSRSIRTFRDAEVAVRELHNRLDNFNFQNGGGGSAAPTTIIQKVEANVNPSEFDIEFTADHRTIVHRVKHKFFEELWAKLFVVSPQYVIQSDSGYWQILPDGTTGDLLIENIISGVNRTIIKREYSATLPIDVTVDGHILPLNNDECNIGSITKKYRKIYSKELECSTIIYDKNIDGFVYSDGVSGIGTLSVKSVADTLTALNVYGKSEVYTKTEVDAMISTINTSILNLNNVMNNKANKGSYPTSFDAGHQHSVSL